ncbi:MAG: Lrp/AsnC ligand binding domain-containing protein [Hadesarchaea archaeon]|nr:Lrp/AsnC ligand binding domain-containing protein [Hadesarchaea archaeon]
MVSAYSLISTEPGKTAEVFQKVKSIEGVKKAECVTGPYDIVARVEVDSPEKFTKVVFGDIRSIAGVTSTTTLIVTELYGENAVQKRRVKIGGKMIPITRLVNVEKLFKLLDKYARFRPSFGSASTLGARGAR